MQPTIVVVSAELYCVQSTMEYIKMNLQIYIFKISVGFEIKQQLHTWENTHYKGPFG